MARRNGVPSVISRTLALSAVFAALLTAQNPTPGPVDFGILTTDPVTGLSHPIGFVVEELFDTAPTLPTPADIVVSASGDLFLTNLVDPSCGGGPDTHVWRVPMNGLQPAQPVQFVQHSNTPVQGHLLTIDVTGTIFCAGTCSLTQNIYRVHRNGSVTLVNPTTPINDPDGIALANFPGQSNPQLFVAAQNQLIAIDINAAWIDPPQQIVPLDVTPIGLNGINNWGRLIFDQERRTFLGGYMGSPTVYRTGEIDLRQWPTTPLPVSYTGPDLIEPLLVLENRTRIWNDRLGSIGVLENVGQNAVFKPLLSGLGTLVRAARAPDGGIFVLDADNHRVLLLRPTFRADQIKVRTGTPTWVTFNIDAAPGRANEDYLIFAGATGATPGEPLVPSGVMPLNFDAVTELGFALTLLNYRDLRRFNGTLDANGKATAELLFWPGVLPVGTTLTLGYVLGNPTDASNAVMIHVLP